ncbi:hypothetical protein TPR58_20745 [Sphingomonas sp. HF-S3]|uniref:Uncharacterized protein n=1 Tax=Sphingomonas rustica TaxID=3103142 RepID=A0ABV0BDM4_9SPHN
MSADAASGTEARCAHRGLAALYADRIRLLQHSLGAGSMLSRSPVVATMGSAE